MCPPTYFEVTYSINPWMDPGEPPDRELAWEQWARLVDVIRSSGGIVEVLEPVEGLPDLVFTSDAGVVSGGRFVKSRPRHPERRPEVEVAAEWFAARGHDVVDLPGGPEAFLEAGEVVPFRGRILASHGFRSTPAGHAALAAVLGGPVISIELTDPRLYHLDAVFAPLGGERAIVAPHAWTRSSGRPLELLVSEPLVLDQDEALTFCANAVVVGERVIMPACPARVGRTLEEWGFDVAVVPVTEFLKAGGSVHCLTLRLDA
jgi:ornithine--oxo-acid transaminase